MHTHTFIRRTLVGTTLLAAVSALPGLPTFIATAHGADAGALQPRHPVAKTPSSALVVPRAADGRVVATGRLIVKFHDSVKARTARTLGTRVQALGNERVDSFHGIVDEHGLRVRQAIGRDPKDLRRIELDAETASGRAQPDLAGMIYVEGPLDRLEVAAPLFNALPIVEFVQFEQEMVYHVLPPEQLAEVQAMIARSATAAPLGGCPEDEACGMSGQDCFATGPCPFCGDFACCTIVGTIDPFCVDEELGAWDIFCVDLANLFCQDGDRCLAPITNGGCYESHPSAGCNDEACCNTVCDVNAFCCDVFWDQPCAVLAAQLCATIVGGATPDLTPFAAEEGDRWQKYLTAGPAGKGTGFANFPFTGDGLSLSGPSSLEEIGNILKDVYGVGTINQARGFGVRVGVVEHTAYVTGPKASDGGELWHEDLENVIPEPGQTILTIQGGVLSPDHGTSCLGQIVAAENGFGVTGIAKDAQGYFFPIVSVEEGGRTLNAMTAAIQTFSAGDVLNFSIGPGGGGTLVSNPAEWILVRLATDKGVACVISAGNDCFNLDANPQANGDSGAIIVGACWPGAPISDPPRFGRFCRLGFSNHCQQCDPEALVHVAAWGIFVTTAGGGDLFAVENAAADGPNKARAYTATFNGTSAAAPIISGLAACLQGLSKQFYGVPLPVEALRTVISGNVDPQCDIQNPDNLPGSPQGQECGGDFDPDAEPRRIGGFPRAFEAGIGVLAGNFFSASPIQSVKVITGTYLYGNKNSIKAADLNVFAVQSVQRSPGSQGLGTPPPITYILGGQTTDIEVGATTNLTPADITGIGVTVDAAASAGSVVMGVYVFDWLNRRWTMIPQIEISLGGGFLFNGGININPGNYVSPGGAVLVRVWTCGLGNVPQHNLLHDFVDVTITGGAGQDPAGG